jgi:excisionase family DNA binding protein
VDIPAFTPGAPVRALYSPKETETLLSVSHAQLYRLIGAGRLDARKIGSRTLITAESIEAFLSSLPKVGSEARR